MQPAASLCLSVCTSLTCAVHFVFPSHHLHFSHSTTAICVCVPMRDCGRLCVWMLECVFACVDNCVWEYNFLCVCVFFVCYVMCVYKHVRLPDCPPKHDHKGHFSKQQLQSIFRLTVRCLLQYQSEHFITFFGQVIILLGFLTFSIR